MPRLPVFFHPDQLAFQPRYEWTFGERVRHPETTVRATSIVAALERATDRFDLRDPAELEVGQLTGLHDRELIQLYRAYAARPGDPTYYPTVFPRPELRADRTGPDPEERHAAGAFCFDTGTPLDADTWLAARWSAACALSAAKAVGSGAESAAYALSRPPGHHATRSLFGGYCYLNNAALAARQLRRRGRVAILDVDFHHGNGTQSLFYADPQVLVVSLHGDPAQFFPYFAGAATEIGRGRGKGFNLNLPLPADTDGQTYLRTLEDQALTAIARFAPRFLIVSVGLDTYIGDPIGKFALTTPDLAAVGERLGRLGLPTVLIQEGGYDTRHLGRNARAFLEAFAAAHQPGPRG